MAKKRKENHEAEQETLLPKTSEEDLRAMPKEEADRVRLREEQEEQRAVASKEYQDYVDAKEEEPRPEDPEKPPEACEQFEGYGEFFVPGDVNIRHQDRKRGDRVALTWEDYQALRDQKVYCEPVPKAEEGQREPPNQTLPV
jgi:hypothetical protein